MDAWYELLSDAQQAHEGEDYRRATEAAREALRALVDERGPEVAYNMSRLLSNAVYEMTQEGARLYKCPRCEAEVMTWRAGEDQPDGYALSRTTRAEGEARIFICERCGGRESIGYQPPPEEWPLSLEELLMEEATLLAKRRGAEVVALPPDELLPSDEDEDDEEER